MTPPKARCPSLYLLVEGAPSNSTPSTQIDLWRILE